MLKTELFTPNARCLRLAFFRNHLHAKYVRDSTGIYTLEGLPGDLISDGLTIIYFSKLYGELSKDNQH